MRSVSGAAFVALSLLSLGFARTPTLAQQGHMMVRIAEIELEPQTRDEYTSILKKEAAASVRVEPGVISIFPMFEKENPSRVRILEIYADRSAYESHLKTPHFLEYKTSTATMVRSLRLVEMSAIDAGAMPEIFAKSR